MRDSKIKKVFKRHASTVVFVLFTLKFILDKRSHPVQLNQLRLQVGLLRKEATLRGEQEPMDYLEGIPIIYAITPTYTRHVQKADLTRLSQTLLLVPNFHWIVIEDSQEKTPLVAKLLAKSGLSYTHLNVPTPEEWKNTGPRKTKPRGVAQRNAALHWLRNNADPRKDAVVYFADDDNTYSLEIFEESRATERLIAYGTEVVKDITAREILTVELTVLYNTMRWTKKVSVWPVGFVGGLRVEAPIFDKNGKFVKWGTVFAPERPFAIDMAGFAINLKLILDNSKALFRYNAPLGYQESIILGAVATKADLEPKADNCSKVYVWHTRTSYPDLANEATLQGRGIFTNGTEV